MSLSKTSEIAIEEKDSQIVKMIDKIGDLTFSRMAGNGDSVLPIPSNSEQGDSRIYKIFEKNLNLLYKAIDTVLP